MNKVILKLEGLLVFVGSLSVYIAYDYRLLWFFVFLLLPDLTMLGYWKGKKTGAFIYNLGHTYLMSGPLLALGLALQQDILVQAGLIWTAHIGIDRLMGYGLKYGTDFKHTHFNRL